MVPEVEAAWTHVGGESGRKEVRGVTDGSRSRSLEIHVMTVSSLAKCVVVSGTRGAGDCGSGVSLPVLLIRGSVLSPATQVLLEVTLRQVARC